MRRDKKYVETHARLAEEVGRPALLDPPLEGGSTFSPQAKNRGGDTVVQRHESPRGTSASPTRQFAEPQIDRPPLKGEAGSAVEGEKSSHVKGRRRGEAALSARPVPSRGKLYRLASNFILPKDYLTIEQVRALDRPGAEVPQAPEKPEPEVRVYWND